MVALTCSRCRQRPAIVGTPVCVRCNTETAETADASMTLSRLLQLTSELQREAYGVDVGSLEGRDYAEYMRSSVLCLTDELHEALRETDWKPWKHFNGRPEDFEAEVKVKQELIDALFWLMNLFAVNRIEADDIEREYARKRLINQERMQGERGMVWKGY